MKESLMAILRSKHTDTAHFRRAAEKMTHLLAQEASTFLKKKTVAITTPLQKTTSKIIDQDVVLIPILRSGLAFLPTFLYYFEQARVGFMGLKRDEKTAIAHEYYRNIPQVKKNSAVIILDPMIATGGSAVATINALKKSGVSLSQIIFVGLIAAPEGIQYLKRRFPALKLVVGVVDKSLNKKKYILPGLGDFGDRYFGTL